MPLKPTPSPGEADQTCSCPPLKNRLYAERDPSRAEPSYRSRMRFVPSQRGDLPAILEMRCGRVTPLPQPRGEGGGGESLRNQTFLLAVRSLLHLLISSIKEGASVIWTRPRCSRARQIQGTSDLGTSLTRLRLLLRASLDPHLQFKRHLFAFLLTHRDVSSELSSDQSGRTSTDPEPGLQLKAPVQLLVCRDSNMKQSVWKSVLLIQNQYL